MEKAINPLERVILLLPGPDKGSIASCHKYLSRAEKPYADVYNLETIKGLCTLNNCQDTLTKIRVIGHGLPGGIMFGNGMSASAADVAKAVVASGIRLDGGCTIAFDNCYAAKESLYSASLLEQVKKELLESSDGDLDLHLVGCRGATTTIGNPEAPREESKRLVVQQEHKAAADERVDTLATKHRVSPGDSVPGWTEEATPDVIRGLAAACHDELLKFSEEFRKDLQTNGWIDQAVERKVTVQAKRSNHTTADPPADQ